MPLSYRAINWWSFDCDDKEAVQCDIVVTFVKVSKNCLGQKARFADMLFECTDNRLKHADKTKKHTDISTEYADMCTKGTDIINPYSLYCSRIT